MIITAKYASTCPCCRQSIQVGSKVEWSKGSPARHTSCGSTPAAQITAAPARRSHARRSPDGERYVKRGCCWECGAYGPLTQDGECGHC